MELQDRHGNEREDLGLGCSTQNPSDRNEPVDRTEGNSSSFEMGEEKQQEGNKEAQTVTTYVVVPPDGGWGWVIVAASFFCNVVVDGIVFSFGVLLPEVSKDLNVSISQAALCGSLLSGSYLICGPFVSALANRYGFRIVAISGSVFGCLAFIAASYSTNIAILCISYGILGGTGLGMIYVPAVIACGFYFEKWRALATGIAVTGSGIGTIVMGPFTKMLITHFNWRTSLLIHACIIFGCSIFGYLFRPLKPVHVEVPSEHDEKNEQNHVPLLQRIKMARDTLKNAESTFSLENDIGITAVDPTEPNNKFLKANNNSLYPTVAEALSASTRSINKSRTSLASHKNHTIKSKPDVNETEKRLSIPVFTELLQNDKKSSADFEGIKAFSPSESLLGDDKHGKSSYIVPELRRDSATVKYRQRTVSECSHKSNKGSRRNTLSKVDVGVRPLYRDDIFLQGSLHRLPQYASKASGLEYTLSVTHLPTSKDIEEEEESKCQLCPEAVRRALATMLDVSLLKSPTFLLFCIAGSVTMMGIFIPFLFLEGRATKLGGMDSAIAIYLVSAIGITNTLGRVVCGAITSMPGVDALFINNVALTVTGLTTMLSGLSLSATSQFSYAIIFGVGLACFASLRSLIIVDLFGIDVLTNAFGILLLFQGVATVIGAPLAALIQDLTNDYDASFYFAGFLLLLSGIMCYPLNILNKWEQNREQTDKTKQDQTA